MSHNAEKDAANECPGIGCTCYGNVELHNLPSAESDALPPALREALIEWVFEACEKYGLPLTNNYPRVQDGVQLHHIGDFTGDLLRAAERAMTRPIPPAVTDGDGAA